VTLFFLTCFILLRPPESKAQSLITTMLEQIAKIELYLQEIKQGYKVVQQGLTTIQNIKKGDFDLHSLFFSSLMTVNPQIKSYAEIADIIAMQVSILTTTKTALSQFSTASLLNKQEQQYISDVFNSLSDLVGEDIDELNGVLSDGNWQMSDDQRLSRIDALYKQVEQKYTFVRFFTANIASRIQQRTQEQQSLLYLSKSMSP
jgi:hypothetical protein